jgi:hypothetical protein
VLWAMFNLIVGYYLFHVSDISRNNFPLTVCFFAGIILMSLFAASTFKDKEKM